MEVNHQAPWRQGSRLGSWEIPGKVMETRLDFPAHKLFDWFLGQVGEHNSHEIVRYIYIILHISTINPNVVGVLFTNSAQRAARCSQNLVIQGIQGAGISWTSPKKTSVNEVFYAGWCFGEHGD